MPVGTDGKENPLLTEKEEKWVSDGGRLILAIGASYGPLRISVPATGQAVQKVFPVWSGVTELKTPTTRVLDGWILGRTHTLFTRGNAPVVSRWPIGSGEVLMFSCYEIFQNAYLSEGDHLKLLEVLVMGRGPVYFDEHAHGITTEGGLLDLVARMGFGSFVILLSVLAGLFFWRQRARIGPPDEDYRETRSEAVDFVAALAPLYNRALPRYQALALYYAALVHATSVRTGLRGDELKERVRTLSDGLEEPHAGGRRDITFLEFDRILTKINEAFRRLEHVKSR